MRFLSQFTYFDTEGFFQDKNLQVTGISVWKDNNTEQVLGSKVECVILSDKTRYKLKDGESGTNIYEKISVKVPSSVNIPVGTYVAIPDDAECTIWGQYRNQLSIKAPKLIILQPKSSIQGQGKTITG